VALFFNPPPGWPTPPEGWTPPADWKPDPSWPTAPVGWQLFIDTEAPLESNDPSERQSAPSIYIESPDSPAITSTDIADGSEALHLRIRDLENELQILKSNVVSPVLELSDQIVLQNMGIYRYNHPLQNSIDYKEKLIDLESKMSDIIRNGRPVLAADLFTFDGSLAKGKKLVNDLSRLMLRAYNAEADNCVRTLKSGNIVTAKKRLNASVDAIEKLGAIVEMRINPEFHMLRIQELELTADFQIKLQEEKENEREQRELLREQKKVEAEFNAERERLNKERTHYITALASFEPNGEGTSQDELRARLQEIDTAIEKNDFRAANIRAGYVYVISNVGAFGPNIVKIGLTRRLEPRERIQELSSASVPFPFDVHALYFSEDAVSLENDLHHAFAEQRVNFVNARREFFFVHPSKVREILISKTGGLLEFNESPDPLEYLQSKGYWPADAR
jgi:hypothetical protein